MTIHLDSGDNQRAVAAAGPIYAAMHGTDLGETAERILREAGRMVEELFLQGETPEAVERAVLSANAPSLAVLGQALKTRIETRIHAYVETEASLRAADDATLNAFLATLQKEDLAKEEALAKLKDIRWRAQAEAEADQALAVAASGSAPETRLWDEARRGIVLTGLQNRFGHKPLHDLQTSLPEGERIEDYFRSKQALQGLAAHTTQIAHAESEIGISGLSYFKLNHAVSTALLVGGRAAIAALAEKRLHEALGEAMPQEGTKEYRVLMREERKAILAGIMESKGGKEQLLSTLSALEGTEAFDGLGGNAAEMLERLGAIHGERRAAQDQLARADEETARQLHAELAQLHTNETALLHDFQTNLLRPDHHNIRRHLRQEVEQALGNEITAAEIEATRQRAEAQAARIRAEEEARVAASDPQRGPTLDHTHEASPPPASLLGRAAHALATPIAIAMNAIAGKSSKPQSKGGKEHDEAEAQNAAERPDPTRDAEKQRIKMEMKQTEAHAQKIAHSEGIENVSHIETPAEARKAIDEKRKRDEAAERER